MTPEQKMVLLSCHEQEQEIAARPSPPAHVRWAAAEYAELQTLGPRYSASAFFGGDDGWVPERQRSRLLRACYQCATDGLLTITKNGSRLAHVKLTAAGRRAVAAILGAESAAKSAKGKRRGAGANAGMVAATVTGAAVTGAAETTKDGPASGDGSGADDVTGDDRPDPSDR